jgi:hypothetical protein
MSRQSKNTRLRAIAKQFSEARKKGQPGPKRTQSKHGKTKAWWQVFKSYAEFISGAKKKSTV